MIAAPIGAMSSAKPQTLFRHYAQIEFDVVSIDVLYRRHRWKAANADL